MHTFYSILLANMHGLHVMYITRSYVARNRMVNRELAGYKLLLSYSLRFFAFIAGRWRGESGDWVCKRFILEYYIRRPASRSWILLLSVHQHSHGVPCTHNFCPIHIHSLTWARQRWHRSLPFPFRLFSPVFAQFWPLIVCECTQSCSKLPYALLVTLSHGVLSCRNRITWAPFRPHCRANRPFRII